MSQQFQDLYGLEARLDELVHRTDIETPEERPHAFLYTVTIDNQSDQWIQIKGRKWILRYHNDETEVVEGDGVVGEFPTLQSGESFTYQSYHLVHQDAVAEGSFFCTTEDNQGAVASLPPFAITLPSLGA